VRAYLLSVSGVLGSLGQSAVAKTARVTHLTDLTAESENRLDPGCIKVARVTEQKQGKEENLLPNNALAVSYIGSMIDES